ncbi:MAG: hypothetical protein MJY65_03170 [Bacteroidaceae bacterium]|nr:hypothetical protein [Bacteroidaceae bacterium]
MRRLTEHYAFTILLTAVIIYLSLFNPSEVGLDDINVWDKLAHSAMYAGLSSVIWLEYQLNNHVIRMRDAVLFMFLCPIILGGMLELIQEHCTEVRSGEWADFLANSIGVAAAVPIGLLVERPILRRSFPRD